jgi:3-phenylpropionate/cinnamic acid dioxygenase small subunit
MDAGDWIEIQQLMARYGHVADSGDLSALSEVFTDDAMFDVSALGGQVHAGIGAVRAFFGLGAPPHPPSHHTTNVLVGEPDAEGVVRVRSKWLTIDRASGGLKSGDYDDEVVRTSAGWRIRRRVATPRWLRGDPVRV